MKIISFDDIKNLSINPEMCYQWVKEMICDKDNVLLPTKISMKPNDKIFCNVMPCMLRGGTSLSEYT